MAEQKINLKVLILFLTFVPSFQFDCAACNTVEHISSDRLMLKTFCDFSYKICKDDINKIPQNINTDLEGLNIYNQSVKILQNNDFQKYLSLVKINIINCKLNKIEKYAFKNLTNLVSLDLRSNNIMDLDQDLFIDLINLQRLQLYNNKIIILHSGMFDNLKNIVSIDLNNNILTTLPDILFKNHQL